MRSNSLPRHDEESTRKAKLSSTSFDTTTRNGSRVARAQSNVDREPRRHEKPKNIAPVSLADQGSRFLRSLLTERFHREQEAIVPDEGLAEEFSLPAGDKDPAVDESSRQETPSESIPLWKRFLDLSLVAASMVVWLPLMLLLMGLVKLSSPGPAFYRQQRIGLRGKPFMIFKFRSMRVQAETGCHEKHFEQLMRTNAPMTKLDVADPRIIPWGRILRATGLDELPQIFNVLRGDMSLVGPRPCTPQEFSRYQAWQRERVNVAPGLTGYWQVNGKNETTFNEMIDMDILYGKTMSLWLDLLIILKTIPALVKQVTTTCRKAPGSAPSHSNRPASGPAQTMLQR